VSQREAAFETAVDESRIVSALKDGDERIFMTLVADLGPSMLRVASMYVSSRAVAEEVVQEAWLGVLRGIDRFEGRSTLKTWVFRILANTAKTRGQRESRSVPLSALAESDDESGYVDLDRFQADGRWIGHWDYNARPKSWESVPDERLVAAETLAQVRAAIDELPATQRTVITLRDVEGWSSEEVCNVLEISETNQRVLLHRARTRVRSALESYIDQE
jgi:RNA polymerase sigma-70 factor (ECF subfamily)